MRSKNLIACILLLLFSITVWAQESAMITGVVTDENKEPLIGVNIAIQNMPGLGVITDINGRYKIKASASFIFTLMVFCSFTNTTTVS